MPSAWARWESLRWDDGPEVCPHCAEAGRCVPLPAGRDGRPAARLVWRCTTCRQQFSALTGTVLAGTRVPLPVWVEGVRALLRAGGPGSARAFAREHGVTAETARQLLARLRAAGIAPGAAVDVDAALRQVLRLPPEVVRRVRAASPSRGGRPDAGPSADYE